MKFIIELEGAQKDLTDARALRLVDIDKLSLAFQAIEFDGLGVSLVSEGGGNE